jgi:hypothetical protein
MKARQIFAIFFTLALAVIAKYIIVDTRKVVTQKSYSQHSLERTHPRQNFTKTAVSSTVDEKSQIQMLIKSEARGLYELSNDSEASELRIHTTAQSFEQSQILELESIAVDESKTTEERLSSVYFLKHAGKKAQTALLHVFSNPTELFNMPAIAHSRHEMNQQFEVALRTMALEAIETNIHESLGSLHLPELKNNKLPKYLNGLYKMVSMGEKIHDPLLKKQMNLNLAQENL